MNISIIMPIYHPDKVLLKKVLDSVEKQKFKGKIELIKVDSGLGLAESMNYGIKKSKYPLIVTLHQDCIPVSDRWLEKLAEPMKNKKYVAAVSQVELPLKLWKNFDFISRIFSAKEQKVITPLLDEKACIYRKSSLIKVGLFNNEMFRTAGEDFDMYIKLRKVGDIAYPDTKVIHMHHSSWKKRMKKELQLSNGFGALVRIYGREMPKWYVGFIKSIPLLGYPLFLAGIKVKKIKMLTIPAIFLYLVVNFIYCYGFWKGFLNRRQAI